MTAFAFAVCLLALASISGLAVAEGPRWALRLPLIVATPLLALAVWWQLSQRDGLPTGAHPVDGSAFVAGIVRAPTPGDAGAIYLWAQPPSSDTPRSYRLPYSPQLERKVAQAARAAKHGQRVGLRTRRRSERPAAHASQSTSSRMSFYRLTPPRQEVKAHSR
jgi:hypothetical protein